MKISYNWLKELLAFNQSPTELAEILTNTGLEVEHVEPFSTIPGGLKGLVVGEVLSKEKHPNADKLSIAQVTIGNDEALNIVCGASNLAVGQKVVVAPVGTELYPHQGESFTIKKAKLRGETSEGMICAEDEIGLGSSHDGIMVLDTKIEVGTPLATLYELKEDYIFEIGLTPNRTDAMSHIGVAKDIAAALNVFEKKNIYVQLPETRIQTKGDYLSVNIKIENQTACPRYSGVVIDKLQIQESPSWLKSRLLAIGVRPINNVVDITNYVLKEYGQALHAFDWEAIDGDEVIVKNLPEGTKFTTLDDVDRKLYAEDLMICNAKEAMCMAGVFGGAQSGVTNSTQTIFLESAYFDSGVIRKTSTRHGLRTDAAQRYEKGADPSISMQALERAVQLLEQYAEGKVASPWYDVYPNEVKRAQITLRLAKLNSLSGHEFNMAQIRKILKDLDFEIIEVNQGAIQVLTPLSRADVTREADLIEEIMRIYGFNNIATPTKVQSTLSFQGGLNKHQLKEQIAHSLNGFGFSEIMTNSITQSNYYAESQELVKLQNSMTSELDSMRASLIPEVLNVIRHNINRKQTSLKFYEFGSVYKSDYTQNEQLALFYTGAVLEENWLSKKQNSTIFHLKGIVQALLHRLQLSGVKLSVNDQVLQLKKKNVLLAEIKSLSSEQLQAFELKQEVFVAILHWDHLVEAVKKHKIKFKEISKFPAVSRDLAVILDENVEFEAIKNKVSLHAGSLLKDLDLFDVFKSEEKIGKGKKSYALNFQLQDQAKTLTDREIDNTMNKIIKTLEKDFDATIRM